MSLTGLLIFLVTYLVISARRVATARPSGGCSDGSGRLRRVRRVDPNPGAFCRRRRDPTPESRAAFGTIHRGGWCRLGGFDELATPQCTRSPGLAPGSGANTNTSFEPGPAARTMPSLTPNFMLRGARLATTTIRRPTRASGG